MHPVLLRLPGAGLVLESHLVLAALAAALGSWLFLRLGRGAGLSGDALSAVAGAAIVGAFAGGRLLDALVVRALQAPSHFGAAGPGWVFYGGLAGALATGLVAARAARLPRAPLLEAAAPALGAVIALGRVGCFLHGCDFGAPTGQPWGVRYPAFVEGVGATAVATWHQFRGWVPLGADSLPVHPTQLYEALLGAALCVGGLALRRLRPGTGAAFWAVLGVYAGVRFGLEALRDDPRGALGPLSTSQALSALLLPASAALLWRALGSEGARGAGARGRELRALADAGDTQSFA